MVLVATVQPVILRWRPTVTDEGDPIDPEDDPDVISPGDSGGPMHVGPSLFSSGFVGAPPPVFVPTKSTPLEEDGESAIPHAALWSMKYRRHTHLFDRTDVQIRESFGSGDQAVYVIDDGRKHCVVSRLVGASPDGCTYCLVAQITFESYEHLAQGRAAVDGVFDDARDFALCAVFEAEAEDAPSNVTLTERYGAIDEVPGDYLSPHPFIQFPDDLDSAT
jgi:hypothetical protein